MRSLYHDGWKQPPPGQVVGVVPIGPGVGRHEIVEEAPAGWHRRLRQFRHAVHGILDSDAMPVHGGRLRQLVDEPTPDALSLPDADDRTRHPPLIAPDRCRRIVGDELCRSRPRLQRWRVGAGRRNEEWEAAGRRHADEPARKCPSGNGHRHLRFGLSSPQLIRTRVEGMAYNHPAKAAGQAARACCRSAVQFHGRSSCRTGLRQVGDTVEDVVEPGLRVDVVQLGGADQGVHHRRPLAPAVGAGEYRQHDPPT